VEPAAGTLRGVQSRSIARQAGLLLVVFVATIVLLAGAWALLARSSNRGGSGPGPAISGLASAGPLPSPPLAASGSASGVPGASTSPGPAGSGASGEPPPVVLLGAGDIADCGSDGDRLTSDLLLREEGVIFTLGDNAYEDGTAEQFEQCYAPTWGRVLERTRFPVPGNHDWNTEGAAGYRAYFGSSATGPDGATWYSRDIGAWHVIVLDSDCRKVGGCGPGSAQGEWLAADLAASDARCTLALYHHPRYSSGEHGDDETVQPLWAELHAGGVDLVLNGHDHDYERFAPMDADGNEQRPGGMRELVVGTGGTGLRQFHATARNSELRLTGTWGVVRLTLRAVNYEWEFLPTAGEIADSGSTPCH
jgi:acid phosphatase type 7